MTPPRTRQLIAIARRPRRGIFLADVLTAMAIVAVLAVSMFVLLARANNVGRKMAGSRAATRAAESLLADLQSARPSLPAQGQEVKVHSEPGGAAVPGYAWVRVTATVAGESADIVGLIPDGPELRRAEAANPTSGPATREAP